MTLPKDVIKYIPEAGSYDEEVQEAFYEIASKLHPDDTEKLLRYYYFGYLLTSDDIISTASKVEISNTKIEQKTGKDGNIYWILYQRLLEALGLSNVGNEVSVVTY